MKLFESFRYRLAIVVFIVQLAVVAVLLWQTQSAAFKEAKQIMQEQDQTILQILSSVSEESLFNEDFFGVQPFYVQIIESPHVITAYLLDYQGDVVVSSNPRLLGKQNPPHPSDKQGYWVSSEFENSGEYIGEINIQFSLTEINKAYDLVLRRSVILGSIGIVITAFLSLLVGGLFTKRIEQIKDSTERFAKGDLNARCTVTGQDELTSLSKSLNQMADQINSNIKEIEHLAFHDDLTGLANRREFDKRLTLAFEAAKTQGNIYSLLYLDLDKFKLVNDTCGHHAGDQLLVQLSHVMLGIIRTRDTLVRFGGDEFGVLLDNCSLSQAEEVANKFLKAVFDFKFSWDDKIMQVGVSIGGIALNSHSDSVDQLLSSVDAACYTAKQKGRNQVHMVVPGDKNIQEHFSDVDWVNRLSTMIENDQFSMACQNIVDISDSHTNFVRKEFLLRIKDEQGQWISPAVFIEAAERFDFIQRLDRYVIDKVFRILVNNQLPNKNIICFINLSGKSVSEETLFDYVQDKINEYELDAKQICFEITETAAIANFNNASVFIEKVREIGCSFALDDFGSGMCSFNYLKSFQVDYVKIDGSFISSMQENDVDRTIVKSINKISHRSGFKTIAEFVENDEILKQVKGLNIDFAQGYGLHKPKIIE